MKDSNCDRTAREYLWLFIERFISAIAKMKQLNGKFWCASASEREKFNYEILKRNINLSCQPGKWRRMDRHFFITPDACYGLSRSN